MLDARRMLVTAARHGRRLLVASKFRHVPDLVRARTLVADGAIGETLAFAIDFSSVVDMSQRWNALPNVAGEGVVVDNGCHAFDIVGFLFGPVARVHATRREALQHLSVEDAATILVGAAGGLTGRVELSWSHPTSCPAYVAINGTRGAIEIGW